MQEAMGHEHHSRLKTPLPFLALSCEHVRFPNASPISDSVLGTWEINCALIMPLLRICLPWASCKAGN